MNAKARRILLPKHKVGAPGFAEADRIDAVECRYKPPSRLDARRFAIVFVGYRPWWFRVLLAVRAVLVRPFGLRSQGRSKTALPNAVEEGSRLAFFDVLEASPQRVLLGAGDSHLASLLLIESRPGAVVIATGVRHRNKLGPVYMVCSRPFRMFVLCRFAEYAALQLLREGD